MVLRKPQLEPLADRSSYAAILLGDLLPDSLECTALYLSSDRNNFEFETHRLLILTSSRLYLFRADVVNPDWKHVGSGSVLGRSEITLTSDYVSVDSIMSVEALREGGAWDGHGREPTMIHSYKVRLAAPLGDRDAEISLPFSKREKYEGDSPFTPEQDLETLIRQLQFPD